MHDVDDLLCTVDEVEHLLDLSKASVPDLVSAHNTEEHCYQPSVTNLFNLSLRQGIVPECWRESMTTPILKSSSKPKSDPNNYRPISLTPIFYVNC